MVKYHGKKPSEGTISYRVGSNGWHFLLHCS